MLLRADKENIGEISKDDWFETLTAAGLHVEMYVFFKNLCLSNKNFHNKLLHSVHD